VISLASLEEFELRIPGGISSGHETRALGALEDASALIRSEASKTWEDEEVPDVIKTICIAAAKRSFINPDAIRSVSIDNYSTSFGSSSPDVYLTAAEKRLVRKAGGKTGVWTQATTRSINDMPDVPGVTDDQSSVPLIGELP
jgi:hypothetical protein